MVQLKFFFLVVFFSLPSLFAYPNYSQAIKEKKLYPMGEKLYKQRCKSIEPKVFATYEAMQDSIVNEKLCKKMNKKYFEALSLYLWDKKRGLQKSKKELSIVVTHDEKCPICGMYVYKYPKWATQIFYGDTHHSFDGVKDMMKYYFAHQEGITKILVRDYYTQEVIDAKSAYFVVGSDVYGPMGDELIALKDKKSAKDFYFDHRGKKILRFDDITQDLVFGL